MGKGSARRKEDTEKIRSNWDAIFKKEPKICECCGKQLGTNDWDIHTCTPKEKE